MKDILYLGVLGSKLMENNVQEEKEILCLKSEGNQSSQAISTVHVVLMDTAIISAFYGNIFPFIIYVEPYLYIKSPGANNSTFADN